ncbi:MAG: hypothetical protein RLZZ385_326 [Pseudomonadota bacterium]
MKSLLTMNLAGLGLLCSSLALAESEYYDAEVVETVPLIRIVEISTPREECWEEEVVVERRYGGGSSNTPVVLSTIIGGAIGNAVGHNKSNQRVGTVVGAVLGHSIGRDIVRQQERGTVREYETVERCETVYERHQEERITGYQVTYHYNGQDYTVRTDRDPGETIRVRVTVQPVL